VFRIASQICIFSLTLLSATSGRCQHSSEQKSFATIESKDKVILSRSVREHMHRVQTWFGETNNDVWYRLAFVAVISDIRPLEAGDKLIGELATGEAAVVVLQIREIGKQNSVGLDNGAVIVIPVGKLIDLWKQKQSQKIEMLFEYNRIGKRVFVQKFGC
jgi:hypothetical protein